MLLWTEKNGSHQISRCEDIAFCPTIRYKRKTVISRLNTKELLYTNLTTIFFFKLFISENINFKSGYDQIMHYQNVGVSEYWRFNAMSATRAMFMAKKVED